MVSGQASSISPGRMSKMPIQRPQPRPTVGISLVTFVLEKLPVDFNVH